MDWYHKVDPDWLKARKDYLCASDIIKLLPTTPTGRPRANILSAYLAVWADKQCGINESDIISRGAAGRGHILEPYAINELNSQALVHTMVHHWDDALVHRDGVSCSPDGLDVMQAVRNGSVLTGIDATYAVEIKSYSSQSHYESGAWTKKEDLMERWQLATAMFVMPTIETASLVFYNPSAEHPLFMRHYDRKDLENELQSIEEIRLEYFKHADTFDTKFDIKCASDTCRPEEDIVDELKALQDQCLNP